MMAYTISMFVSTSYVNPYFYNNPIVNIDAVVAQEKVKTKSVSSFLSW